MTNVACPIARGKAAPRLSGSEWNLTPLVGLAAVVFSVLYLISDLMELNRGGFSTSQLVVTYIAEAAIPLFVLGLYVLQSPQIGRLGLLSAVLYAYTFVYFTGTVMYALVERTSDWQSLKQRLGLWLTIHSVLMVVAGVGFGIAVIRARVRAGAGAELEVSVLPLSATIEVPATRETVRHLLDDAGYPFLVLRFGVLDPAGAPRTPRLTTDLTVERIND